MNGMPRSQCLFHKVAAFDDRSEVSAVALKQVEIPTRIAVDDHRLAKARGTISPILPDCRMISALMSVADRMISCGLITSERMRNSRQ